MDEEEPIKHYYDSALLIVKEASKIVLEGFNKTKTISIKDSFNDVVTEYDKMVETLIKERLMEMFPQHEFLGEESYKGELLTERPTWILDPIDGTNNFVHRCPESAISLGLLINKEPIVGVICNPMQNKTYSAYKGNGCFLNGSPIKVSGITDIQQALIGIEISLGGKSKEIHEVLQKREYFCVEKSMGVRSGGSAALGLCHVAEGEWDAYHTEGLAVWDVAAGVVLVREAGGTVTHALGSELDLMAPSILATCSKELADTMIGAFNDIRR